MRRQERYRLSGMRGLWLFWQAMFPVSEALPAARVLGTPREGFTAVLDGPANQIERISLGALRRSVERYSGVKRA